ncbi:MAG: 4Fe-4S binding protein [Clostridiales bacterium]|nr:4Fe-4S binding protein [Clostridiales bacterium]
MKSKIKLAQIMRHLVQTVLFFTFPGLYILAFSELKGLYTSIISGSFSLLGTLSVSAELFIVVAATLLFGRFFCGWACAFGTYNDFLHEISSRVFHIKFKPGPKLDAALKYLKYVFLVFLVVVIWTSGSTVLASSNPWDAFATITDFSQMLSMYSIGFALLALISVGAFFIERFFCRYLCPLGAIFNITSRLSIIRIKMPKEKCGACNACTNVCSMGIPLKNRDMVRGGECINCMKCVEVCPRKNAHANLAGADLDAKLVSSVAVAACICMYSAGQLGVEAISTYSGNSGSSSLVSGSTSQSVSQKYADGTYTGTGTGFRGGTTTVSVTVKNGTIASIETLSYEDDRPYYQRAESSIVGNMIETQSADVDTVSGATFSSNGIISAVKDALSQAEQG